MLRMSWRFPEPATSSPSMTCCVRGHSVSPCRGRRKANTGVQCSQPSWDGVPAPRLAIDPGMVSWLQLQEGQPLGLLVLEERTSTVSPAGPSCREHHLPGQEAPSPVTRP